MKFLKKPPLKFWIILIACAAIFLISYSRFAANLEAITYDFRLKMRPPLATLKDIVIIEIDDFSIETIGVWPFPRDFHAELLRYLKSAGTKAVFFDILFSEPSVSRTELPANTQGVLVPQNVDLDAEFEQQIKESGNVYLPESFIISQLPSAELLPPVAQQYSALIYKQFKQHVRGTGHINTFTDPDGKLRKIPLFVRYNNTLVPHIGLKMACDVMGIDARKVIFTGRRVVIDGKLSLPVSGGASFLVNYPARWKSSFTHISYAQLLKAQFDREQGLNPSFDPSMLNGKVCFVGLTATGTHDLKGMPFEELYPMLGLQASVFNSIMSKRFITDIGPIANSLLNLIVFFMSLFLCFYFSPLKALSRIVTLSCIYFISATGLIFIGLWIDLFLPLLIIAITYVVLTLYKFIEEVHKRQLLEKELDIARAIQKSFLPKDIQKHPAVGIAAFMQPAKFVGGDLYDIVMLPHGRLGVFIGDVSGKGVPAALIMAQTVSLFRIFARVNDNPAQVLMQLNRELCQVLEGRFVTAFYLIFDVEKNILEASCAGHFPILTLNVGTAVSEVLPVAGPPLGVLDQVEYETFQVALRKDDKFLLYTDGVTEARNKKEEEFGMDRLKEVFSRNASFSGQEALNAITGKLFEFSKGLAQFDDITAILLEYR
jgi:adenylate cyclase